MEPPGLRRTIGAAFLVVLPLLPGCAIGYYVDLVQGQYGILADRRPVEEVLRDPTYRPKERSGLLWLGAIRAWADAHLGLRVAGSYETVHDPGGPAAVWNLSAAPPDRLVPVTWTYPFVGVAPYRGFFDRADAVAARDDLRESGFDTFLYGASAYSTLGWFEDPVFRGMLSWRPARLAATVIHELIHRTVWASGDVTWNESLAEFCGNRGARAFLVDVLGADHPEVAWWDARLADERRFAAFMEDLHDRLARLYGRDLPREATLRARQGVFRDAKERFAGLPLRTDAFDGFVEGDLNNAIVLAFRRYHDEPRRFEAVLEAVGGDLARALPVFRRAARRNDPGEALARWLAARGR